MSASDESTSPIVISPPSNSFSNFVPSSQNYPFFCQSRAGLEQDFAANASLMRPANRGPIIRDTHARLFQPYPSYYDQGSTGVVSREEEKTRKAVTLKRHSSHKMGAVRNRLLQTAASKPHRLRIPYHYESYPSVPAPPSALSSKLPLELPPPTSPTRCRIRLKPWFSNPRWSRFFLHPAFYLALYFAFNLCLTLYNKLLLNSFPFPYVLSSVHSLCGSVGTHILVRRNSTPTPKLDRLQTLVLLAFSALYTFNIIISNVSLGLVTVPFHQVVRASTPLFTIIFSTALGARSSRSKLLALVPVVTGVGLATYGDYYFTHWGFILTLLGTILASLKTIYTNILQAPSRLQNSSKHHSHPLSDCIHLRHLSKHDPTLHAFSSYWPKLPPLTPLQFLYLLSPLAFAESAVLAYLTGEFGRLLEHPLQSLQLLHESNRTSWPLSFLSSVLNTQVTLLLMNGVIAFGLNVVSFSANRKVGALGMTVAANVKQVLTVLCAVALFDLTITPMNAAGIVLTLLGGAVYAFVELKERRESRVL